MLAVAARGTYGVPGLLRGLAFFLSPRRMWRSRTETPCLPAQPSLLSEFLTNSRCPWRKSELGDILSFTSRIANAPVHSLGWRLRARTRCSVRTSLGGTEHSARSFRSTRCGAVSSGEMRARPANRPLILPPIMSRLACVARITWREPRVTAPYVAHEVGVCVCVQSCCAWSS